MAPRQRKKAKRGDSMTKSLLSVVSCPITHCLVVDPVVAEDGHTYEREAITRWLRDKGKSPMTNQTIGTHVVALHGGRDMVLGAIEAGAVDDKDAAAWHVQSARRIAAAALPGGTSKAREHLETAEALAPSAEAKTLLRAANFRQQLDGLLGHVEDFASSSAAAGVEGVADFVLGGRNGLLAAAAAPAGGEAVMHQWEEFAPHAAVVRIIESEEELEDLCEREAPGAQDAVGWDDEMVHLCGKAYIVKTSNSVNKSYNVDSFWVPFDACIMLARIDR